MRFGAVVLAALVGLAVVAVLVLVNGGYAYRAQCPGGSEATETSWSYRIADVVPYKGFSRPGCSVHSAARVGLDAIGLWRIPDTAAAVVSGHTAEYRPEQIEQAKERCVKAGEEESFCDCAMDELTRRFSPREFQQISSAAQYEDLPGSLARRAERTVAAVSRGCRR